MEDDDIIQRIDDYLDGLLSEADSDAFEEAMDRDPSLEKKVKAARLARIAEKALLYRYIKEDLQSLSDNPSNRLPTPWWQRYKWGLGAALLCVAFGVVYYLLPDDPTKKQNDQNYTEPPVTPDDSTNTKGDTINIAQQLKSPAPDNRLALLLEKQQRIVHERGTVYDFKDDSQKGQNQDDTLSLYSQAVQAYNKGKMRQVLKLLERPVDGQEIMSTYLRAHAYFKIGDYRRAADNFQAVSINSEADVLDREKAQWYELLSRLCFQEAQDTAVQRLFQAIEQNPQHLFLKETLALKEDLSGKK